MVLNIILILFVFFPIFFVGHQITKSSGAKTAATIGCAVCFGAVCTIGVYKQSAVAYYPDQAQIFAEMNEYMFIVIAASFFVWFAGISFFEYQQKKRKPKPALS